MDNIIGANVTLQHNGQTVNAKIMERAIVSDGKHIAKYNHNPILYSRKYELELLDGVVDEYYHNIILENLLPQVYKEGRESIRMKQILYHKINKSSIREWKKGQIKKRTEATSGMERWNTVLYPS